MGILWKSTKEESKISATDGLLEWNIKKMSKDKLFIVRYYVKAKNAKEALKKARQQEADDVWVDEEWKKGNAEQLASAIGFQTERSDSQTIKE